MLLIVEYFIKDQTSAATFKAITKERRSAMKEAGCNKMGRYVNQDDSNHIVTMQRWISREHQAEYIKWTSAQPNNEEFHACWAKPPRLTWVDKAEQ